VRPVDGLIVVDVVLPHDGHGTYDLDDIPAATVARVAAHALGDQPELVPSTTDLTFTAPGR
jgi:streptothricin hydrolase